MFVGDKWFVFRLVLIVNVVVMCIFFSFSSIYSRSSVNSSVISKKVQSNEKVSTTSSKLKEFEFEGFNGTHLWSMRIADEKHVALARRFPCRIVNYTIGSKFNLMDTCDNSSNKDFTIENSLFAQKWLFEHQNPSNCSNKRFAIIKHFAWSGFGSVMHQIVWPFGAAIGGNRIAVYHRPDDWIYTDCPLGNPDCSFLPLTNCSLPSKVDGDRVIELTGNSGHWSNPIYPSVFQNRSFNWYRSQLLFYLMRYNPSTLNFALNMVSRNFPSPSVDAFHPFISIYVRRSDKVQFREMQRPFSLSEYFDLFDLDAQRFNISNVFLNSEDANVFEEFSILNKQKRNRYKLLKIEVTRNTVFREMQALPPSRREKITKEFLADLFIEANADVHVGTLTSNWCRLVDEMRLVLGKFIPFYTPENTFIID